MGRFDDSMFFSGFLRLLFHLTSAFDLGSGIGPIGAHEMGSGIGPIG